MISSQTIRKLSFSVAVASFAFTIAAALIQYLLLDLTTLGAPAGYYLYSVLLSVIPYLFIGVLALLVSLLWHDEEAVSEKALSLEPEATQTVTT